MTASIAFPSAAWSGLSGFDFLARGIGRSLTDRARQALGHMVAQPTQTVVVCPTCEHFVSVDDRQKHDLLMLGRAIRALREQRGLHVSELAAATGIDSTRLDALERGQLDPDLELLRKLAEGMNLRPSAFFVQAERMSRPDDDGAEA